MYHQEDERKIHTGHERWTDITQTKLLLLIILILGLIGYFLFDTNSQSSSDTWTPSSTHSSLEAAARERFVTHITSELIEEEGDRGSETESTTQVDDSQLHWRHSSLSETNSDQLPTTPSDLWLHDQQFFCTLAPFITLKETVEKHIIFGKTGVSFLMFLLPYGRDIVSTEIHSQRGWDNTKTKEMLRLMQGHKPKVNQPHPGPNVFVRTPEDEMSEVESKRVFLDIGANIGWFTLNIAAGGYRVISFEPLQHNEIALRTSICRNPGFLDRVRYFNLGLGGEDGQCAVYSESRNVGDGHVMCRTATEIAEARRILAEQTTNSTLTNATAVSSQQPQRRRLLQQTSTDAAQVAPTNSVVDDAANLSDEMFPLDAPLNPIRPPVVPHTNTPPSPAPALGIARAYFRSRHRRPPTLQQQREHLDELGQSSANLTRWKLSPHGATAGGVKNHTIQAATPAFERILARDEDAAPLRSTIRSSSTPPPPIRSTAMVRMKSLSLTKEWNTTGLIPNGYYVRNELRLVRLDSIVRESIHLMKIDVEGFEAHVLKGSTRLFDDYDVTYIIAEYSPRMLLDKGSDPGQHFLQFFHQRQYEIRWIQHGFDLTYQVQPTEFDTFCQSDQRHSNRQCELFMARTKDLDLT